ncbi:MAG: endonuclease/exonuclease/phosphatase family protein [Deltaproteobacteria bacterium]|nr:endonuclease/exonuclease/phosphatase family protein [Deltaproteobacteria bacterium]
MTIRIATFNLENLDIDAEKAPPIEGRIAIMQPQLQRIAADVICFQEIHSQKNQNDKKELTALNMLLANTRYSAFQRKTTLTQSNELYSERNLVTLSRFNIAQTEIIRTGDGPQMHYQMMTANPPDEEANPIKWERPMLYTQIKIGTETLHLINVHLKSKLASNIPGQKEDYEWKSVSAWAEGSFLSAVKRVGQALQARMRIDRIFDEFGEDALIAIVGDFNADIHEVSMKAICGPVEETGNPAHGPRRMIPCENNIPKSSRYSLIHLGEGAMLDHIFVSRGLLSRFKGAEIHNETLPDESGAFRTDTLFPESDHAPVIAEFDIEV